MFQRYYLPELKKIRMLLFSYIVAIVSIFYDIS